MRDRSRRLILGLALAASGCNLLNAGEPYSGYTRGVAAVVSGPAALFVGESATYTATLRYWDGTSMPGAGRVEWSSSNPAAATVTQDGVVTAHAAGETLIGAMPRPEVLEPGERVGGVLRVTVSRPPLSSAAPAGID